jgi:tetratricopeptide (TPR) repeat protein
VPLELPPPPPDQTSTVKAWSQPVVIPTYLPQAPDKNPMFLEKRVYQGSSGRVYPLPFIDRIATESVPHTWQALHIENDWIRVMILPEIGGRIHVGLDKTNGYDFFYRQNVIKPALVGLAGPWISGGVEFNWPQHHRPATFMPVETLIERHEDGSQTIWSSDHDPMNRLKGMHGVCLHPERAYVELKVRLYNRTPFVQTFLWWANVAAHVHEWYQSFFPPDVHYVADHARRAMSSFPLCNGVYYGVDYGARGLGGVPVDEQPRQFVPPGGYPSNDLSWYANIPVPTSYMALHSDKDFCGGYDHRREAGLVHVADHHIAPGKKQWTWGNHEFGYAWNRNLTDSDGPYVELMAGVYTDNQPDFSFLAPGETKTFSQFWYPIQKIGPVSAANLDAAVSVRPTADGVRVGVNVTRTIAAALIHVDGEIKSACLAPGRPYVGTFTVDASRVTVQLEDGAGNEVIRYKPEPHDDVEVPRPATEPPLPEQAATNDELYFIGLHLEQYRHATRGPELYWREALRRDPGDARCNNALGLWYLRRGEFSAAERHFRCAIAAITRCNANPSDGEPFYNLGLSLRFMRRDADAYAAFYKSTWNFAWKAAGHQALAELDAKQGRWAKAIEHSDVSLRHNPDNLDVINLRVIALRKLGRTREADKSLQAALKLDPLNAWARHQAGQPLAADNQLLLDVAFDYQRCGLMEEARQVLLLAVPNARDGSMPILYYALDDLEAARSAPPDYCFPSRLEEMLLLEKVARDNPDEARAPYYLGNFFYDRRRHLEAIECWERAAKLDPAFPTVWRNLGIGYFNIVKNEGKAQSAFEKAWRAGQSDARILYERDQLWKRLGVAPEKRLAELEAHRELVLRRDDLSVELATLYNLTRRYDAARSLLASRRFQPWEGGEGLALGQHIRTHLALGRQAMLNCDLSVARREFEAALESPENLGEARHLLANSSNIHYWLGMACRASGDQAGANRHFRLAAKSRNDFEQMSVRAFSAMTFYSGMAMDQLGELEEARNLLDRLLDYAAQLACEESKIDYFATSLPTMLLFDEDLRQRNSLTAQFLEAQARYGLGEKTRPRALVKSLLEQNPNHSLAADFEVEMDCLAEIRSPAVHG